jgi:hypothetical protein
MLFAGKVQRLLQDLHRMRDSQRYAAHRGSIQGEINYFTENKERMRYDIYRASRHFRLVAAASKAHVRT